VLEVVVEAVLYILGWVRWEYFDVLEEEFVDVSAG